jgi:hypothetical protein
MLRDFIIYNFVPITCKILSPYVNILIETFFEYYKKYVFHWRKCRNVRYLKLRNFQISITNSWYYFFLTVNLLFGHLFENVRAKIRISKCWLEVNRYHINLNKYCLQCCTDRQLYEKTSFIGRGPGPSTDSLSVFLFLRQHRQK